MIRCYYTKETLDTVARAGRCRAIRWGGVWYGGMLIVAVGGVILNPENLNACLLIFCSVWCGAGYLYHWILCKVEKTTLQHAGDEITLDDNEIRLVTAGGTQITFPRKGLWVQRGYFNAAGNVIYTISNPKISEDKIVLTPHMANARELLETIRPGIWDNGD